MEEVMVVSELVGALVDNVEAEIHGIALAMETALKTMEKKKGRRYRAVHVFTDCEAAIMAVMARRRCAAHHKPLRRIRRAAKRINDQATEIRISWVPGHADLEWNELADKEAKRVLLGETQSCDNMEVSFETCKKLIRRQLQMDWQRQWNRLQTGRSTHSIFPVLPANIDFPSDRCTGVSFSRLLLNDTLLMGHQFRKNMSETNACECDEAIEDVEHYLLKCYIHQEPRLKLVQQLQKIWCEDRRFGSSNVVLSVDMLLSGFKGTADSKVRNQVWRAVWEFILETKKIL
jgi:ribonuclease HI